MYLEPPQFLTTETLSLSIRSADYLILMRPETDRASVPRAIVRKAAMFTGDNGLCGKVKIGQTEIQVQGNYGNNGNACYVPDKTYKQGVPLPSALFCLYVNSANGEEREELREWAMSIIGLLVPQSDERRLKPKKIDKNEEWELRRWIDEVKRE